MFVRLQTICGRVDLALFTNVTFKGANDSSLEHPRLMDLLHIARKAVVPHARQLSGPTCLERARKGVL